MVIDIKDDFDLEKIRDSGQCFRVKRSDGDRYRFITGDHVLYMQKQEDGKFEISCDMDAWVNVWIAYFDLSRSYCAVADAESGKHPFVDRAIKYGRGLRLLRQDPWEMLVTFIISQRKSIPAIAKCVEAIAGKFGHDIITDMETLKTFPTAEEMKYATESDLKECGLGYRAKYVMDTIAKVNTGSLNLDAIAGLPDSLLLEELRKVYGVGKKVADCIALFAFGRTACAPVDVWILRAINNECGGISPFDLYGDNAGIIQQYLFYYEREFMARSGC